jgi:hypothetical protein
MKKTSIILFVVFVCLHATTQEVQKIRIDPSKAYGGSVSEYFSNVEYIPLETNKESLFGDARNIIITDRSIVVYDYDTRATLFFTPKGKFIRKNKEKEASFSRIYFDRETDQIAVITDDEYTKKRILKYYSKTGIPANNAPLQVTASDNSVIVPIGSGYFASGSSFYLWLNEQAVDSSFGLIKIYKNNKIYKSFIPHNQKTNLAASILVGSVEVDGLIENNTFYIATPLEHEIYKITKDTAEKIAILIFPADRSFTQEIIKSQDRKMLDNLNRTISNDIQKILFVNKISLHNHFLSFRINSNSISFASGSEASTSRNFIYNIENGRLVSLERINTDSSNYFLPISGMNTILSGYTYLGGNFYTQISSFEMFAAYEKNKNKNPQYPPALQEYFKTQNRKSNPVIVKMILRE